MVAPIFREQGSFSQLILPERPEWDIHDIRVVPGDEEKMGWHVMGNSGEIIVTVPEGKIFEIISPSYILHASDLGDPIHIKHRRTSPNQPAITVEGTGENASLAQVARLSVLQAGSNGSINIKGLDVKEELSLGNGSGVAPQRNESVIDIEGSLVLGLAADSKSNAAVRRLSARRISMQRGHLFNLVRA